MTDPAVAAPRLTPDQLEELQTLLVGADSVELKLTVPDADQRSAVQALEIDPLEAEIRQVFFFDTPDLGSTRPGSSPGPGASRARSTTRWSSSARSCRASCRRPPQVPEGSGSRSTRCRAASSARRRSRREAARPERCAGAGARAAAGSSSPRSSGPSSRSTPRTALELDDLSILGPILVLKLKFAPQGSTASWSPSCGSTPTARGSSSCPPSAAEEAFEVAARDRAFLEHRGVDLSGEQQTKTKTALEFFSAELR